MKKERIGSTLESLFEELGELEEFKAGAKKRIFAYDLEQAMKRKKVTRAELAKRMGTARPVVYRMLDKPDGITLDTMERAAAALGFTVEVRLAPRAPAAKAPARRRVRQAA
jgi:transcriptional regulator with XRE-family HTH domain